MTEIIAYLKIFILLTCAIYAVVCVAKDISHCLSKEPEPKPVPICNSCKHLLYKGNGGGEMIYKYRCDCFTLGFDECPEYCRTYKPRENSTGATEDDWISVKDRLPETCGDYLVYYIPDIFWERNPPSLKGYVDIKSFDILRKEFFDSQCRCYLGESITHWMPLPTPPEVPHEES